MDQSALAEINDMRGRILRARDLRAEGKHAEALEVEPTAEELREGLLALRASRATARDTRAAKRQPAIDPNANLNDLFGAPPK